MNSIKVRDKEKTFTITGVREEDLALLKLKRKRPYAMILTWIFIFLLTSAMYVLAWNTFVVRDATPIEIASVAPTEPNPDGQEIAIGDKVSVHVTRANKQNWTKVHILTISSIALASILVAKKVHKKIGRR